MQTAMKALCGGLVWAALVTCFCSATGDNHDIPQQHPKQDDMTNMQADNELTMVKRAWNNMPQAAWGKRAWRNMPAAWGKRFAEDKRAWQKLQPMWGKRYGSDDEWSLAESSDNDPQYDDYSAPPSGGEFEDLFDEDKRAWKSMNGPWGKRATHDWGNFRGSWGKRDPAWNNLKGLWGKRSFQDRISS